MIGTVSVFPHRVGLLYKSMKLSRVFVPGVYFIFAPFSNIVQIFTGKSTEIVTNQTVYSSENIELKISYFFEYSINNPELLVKNYDLFVQQNMFIIKQDLYLKSQIALRDVVFTYPAKDVLVKRAEISKAILDSITPYFAEKGVQLEALAIRDVTLKADLRALYAEEYMIERKANLVLASARSQVASSRALANTAKIFSENENVKFLKLLETLEKLSTKTGNTIHIHMEKTE